VTAPPDSIALPLDLDARTAPVRAAAREHLVPIAERGQPHRVNRELVRALAEQGLLGRIFPRRLGGTAAGEVSAVELCVLREALATEGTDAETALALQGLGAYPIVQSGTAALAGQWVPAVARGEAVAAFALSEPEAGSDAAGLELRAERDRDGWLLTGTKTWISNAPEADVYTVFARTTPGARARGVTAFAVPGDAPGLTGEPLRLLAPHAIGRLRFDRVAVPGSRVLGEVDGGFEVAMRTLDLFRASVGAFAVGMSQAALEAALAHAAGRRTFGSPLHGHQAVAHMLAEMATRTQAARLLVYEAAAAFDAGASTVTRRSAMAKLYATETAQFVVDAAIQVHGAAGLEEDHRLAHLYRDVRAPRIYEGTSEIQRTVIARELYR
jgi:alkylation response protein AidB-like acyl-CoA dehydrogenase